MRLIYIAITILVLAGAGFYFYKQGAGHLLSKHERTLSESVVVQKEKDGDYEFYFNKEGEYTLYKGLSPDKIDWSTPILTMQGSEIELDEISPDKRLFFGITGDNIDTIIVSERLIPLEGTLNFRDVGGIPTADGRVVKWGKVYRSGKLSKLTKRDLRYFGELNIQTILDFRNDVEIKKDPDRYPTSYDVQYLQYPIGDKSGETYVAYEQKVRSGEIKGKESKALFIELMKQFADTVAKDFKPLFTHLQEAKDVPLVYHCTGGKDRTGFATAMFLSALNVERKTVINDYLMSNYYRYDKNLSNMRKARLVRMDTEMLGYLMQVNEDYINAVFEVIDDKFDGIDNYLEVQFGLTKEVREKMIQMYTYDINDYLPQVSLVETRN